MSQFSLNCARIFKYGMYMYIERLYRRIETQGHGFYFSNFIHFFFLSLYYMLTLKIFVGSFLKILKPEY